MLERRTGRPTEPEDVWPSATGCVDSGTVREGRDDPASAACPERDLEAEGSIVEARRQAHCMTPPRPESGGARLGLSPHGTWPSGPIVRGSRWPAWSARWIGSASASASWEDEYVREATDAEVERLSLRGGRGLRRVRSRVTSPSAGNRASWRFAMASGAPPRALRRRLSSLYSCPARPPALTSDRSFLGQETRVPRLETRMNLASRDDCFVRFETLRPDGPIWATDRSPTSRARDPVCPTASHTVHIVGARCGGCFASRAAAPTCSIATVC